MNYDFELEYADGTTEVVTVPADFSDAPGEVIMASLAHPAADRTAFLLAWRLDVPLATAQVLVADLLDGEGVKVI